MTVYEYQNVYSLDEANIAAREGWRVSSTAFAGGGRRTVIYTMERQVNPYVKK